MPVRGPTPTSFTPGEFVTETLEYDDGRQAITCVPAVAAEAVVLSGDGELITSWIEVLEAADLPPTMIIGAHRVEDETVRLREYSPGRTTVAFAFDPQRFAAHEKFFVEDVRRWARTRLAVRLASRPNRLLDPPRCVRDIKMSEYCVPRHSGR